MFEIQPSTKIIVLFLGVVKRKPDPDSTIKKHRDQDPKPCRKHYTYITSIIIISEHDLTSFFIPCLCQLCLCQFGPKTYYLQNKLSFGHLAYLVIEYPTWCIRRDCIILIGQYRKNCIFWATNNIKFLLKIWRNSSGSVGYPWYFY